jgi:hypothetical protein
MRFSRAGERSVRKAVVRTVVIVAVGAIISACVTSGSHRARTNNIHNYVDPMHEVIAIHIDEGRALIWLPHSDLTLEGKECSDIQYFCIELPFSVTIVIPRNLFDASTIRWSSRGVTCELTGASELQKKRG